MKKEWHKATEKKKKKKKKNLRFGFFIDVWSMGEIIQQS
jgi:hypothetical protein